MVRPWKELTSVKTVARSFPYLSWLYLRAALIAPSFASAPELAKKTRFRPLASANFLAKREEGSVKNKFEVWASELAWCTTAFSQSSSAQPRLFTPMPLVKSKYSLPSKSHTWQPLPCESARLNLL